MTESLRVIAYPQAHVDGLRLARLCRGVKSLLQHLVQEPRRRCRNVEGFDAPQQWERDEVVAHRSDPRTEPFALGSEDRDDAAAVVRLIVGSAGPGGRAVDEAGL